MKILILLKAEEIFLYNGLFDLLCKLTYSVNEKGINAQIDLYKSNVNYNNDVIITTGSLNIENQTTNIVFTEDYSLVTYNFFEAIKSIFCIEAKQFTVKIFGDISNIVEKLKEIENNNKDKALIFLYREGLISTIKVLSKKETGAVYEIYNLFNKNIYADEDVTLDKMLLEILSIRGKTLSVAESLTGGMICSTLVNNSGASDYLNEGLVTYSNKSKIIRLEIDEEIIKKYGAVSYETAYEMAAGLFSNGLSDVTISTTGVAGPTGGTLTKPVGLTYIAIGTKDKVHVFRHIFKGNRKDVRKAASQAAMFYAIKILKDNSIDYEEIVIN